MSYLVVVVVAAAVEAAAAAAAAAVVCSTSRAGRAFLLACSITSIYSKVKVAGSDSVPSRLSGKLAGVYIVFGRK